MLAHRNKEWKTKWELWLKNLKIDAVTRLDHHPENPTKDWLYRQTCRLNMRVVLLTDKQTDQLIAIRIN